MKKQTLLNAFDGADANQDQLNINANFASKFEHNKRRELLEQGKLKHGDMPNAAADN